MRGVVFFLYLAALAQELPFRIVDLNVNTAESVRIGDRTVVVKLLSTGETRDRVRSAIREAHAEVEIDGTRATLSCGNYQLPVNVGAVRVDCEVTKAYYNDSNRDWWGLDKDARLRVWRSSGSLMYPVHQRWFANQTQMGNEPTFLGGGEAFRSPTGRPLYYHAGLDIGGTEVMAEVVAAADGVVVVRGEAVLPEHASVFRDYPRLVEHRYETVYTLDANGWYYRYSHLQSIDPAIQPGARVRMGQKIGVLGKEGDSGGWSHLHFHILGWQPSGKLGTIDGYALLWEAYIRQYKPDLIAVARPHLAALAGERVRLDGTRSWSRDSHIARYEWHFEDGSAAQGAAVERTYARPGNFSEILKITDASGHTAYDFATVCVLDPEHPERVPAMLHAVYSPSVDIQPGQAVTFKVRAFGAAEGQETWDFGDGTPAVTTRSDGGADELARNGYAAVTHVFEKPGEYLVRVERTRATARLHVHVGAAR